MRTVFVKTVYVNRDKSASVAKALKGYLRGQWVEVDGLRARVVNHTGKNVVLWMMADKMVAVWP